MDLEEQVLSVQQINHLKELGVEVKDTALTWVKLNRDRYGNFNENAKWKIEVNPYYYYVLQAAEFVPTLTLQEVLEMLPDPITVLGIEYQLVEYKSVELGDFSVDYVSTTDHSVESIQGKTRLEAAYKMLCWVAKNNYLMKS